MSSVVNKFRPSSMLITPSVGLYLQWWPVTLTQRIIESSHDWCSVVIKLVRSKYVDNSKRRCRLYHSTVTPKRTENNLFIHIGKSETEVTSASARRISGKCGGQLELCAISLPHFQGQHFTSLDRCMPLSTRLKRSRMMPPPGFQTQLRPLATLTFDPLI